VNSGLKKEDRDKTIKGWEIVQKNVARIADAVKDILYCAKEREHELNVIEPNRVVREVFNLFHETAAIEQIELAIDLDPGLGPMKLNAEDLHTVISNLLNNAIEACKFDRNRRDHRVALRTKRKGPLAIFEVCDNGPGIPEEYEDYLLTDTIFSTKGNHGTGLGLMVTRKIVKEFGGSITFSPSPGKGSTFRVTFPIE